MKQSGEEKEDRADQRGGRADTGERWVGACLMACGLLSHDGMAGHGLARHSYASVHHLFALAFGEDLAISHRAGIEDRHPQAGERDEHASGNEDALSDAVPTRPSATE